MIEPQADSGERVNGSQGVTENVADPRVQAALERIADSAGIDLEAMPEVLEDVYRRLNSALADEPSTGQAGTTVAGSNGEDLGRY